MVTFTVALRSVSRWLVSVFIVFAASAAHAREFALHVAAAGPQWATITLEQDAGTLVYSSAQKVIGIYVRSGGVAAAMGAAKNTVVYVVYFNGKIAKFKVTNPNSTIPAEFVEEVPSVPGSAIRLSVPNVPVSEYFFFDVIPVITSNMSVVEVSRAKVPSVEVTQFSLLFTFNIFNPGGGCGLDVHGDCSNPVHQ
jgi:hypothetical protein